MPRSADLALGGGFEALQRQRFYFDPGGRGSELGYIGVRKRSVLDCCTGILVSRSTQGPYEIRKACGGWKEPVEGLSEWTIRPAESWSRKATLRRLRTIWPGKVDGEVRLLGKIRTGGGVWSGRKLFHGQLRDSSWYNRYGRNLKSHG